MGIVPGVEVNGFSLPVQIPETVLYCQILKYKVVAVLHQPQAAGAGAAHVMLAIGIDYADPVAGIALHAQVFPVPEVQQTFVAAVGHGNDRPVRNMAQGALESAEITAPVGRNVHGRCGRRRLRGEFPFPGRYRLAADRFINGHVILRIEVQRHAVRPDDKRVAADTEGGIMNQAGIASGRQLVRKGVGAGDLLTGDHRAVLAYIHAGDIRKVYAVDLVAAGLENLNESFTAEHGRGLQRQHQGRICAYPVTAGSGGCALGPGGYGGAILEYLILGFCTHPEEVIGPFAKIRNHHVALRDASFEFAVAVGLPEQPAVALCAHNRIPLEGETGFRCAVQHHVFGNIQLLRIIWFRRLRAPCQQRQQGCGEQ